MSGTPSILSIEIFRLPEKRNFTSFSDNDDAFLLYYEIAESW